MGSPDPTRPLRTALHSTAADLAAGWNECHDDPQAIVVLRWLVLAAALDRIHPLDTQVGCSHRSWHWHQSWPWLARARCRTCTLLHFAARADPCGLWQHLVYLMPGPPMPRADVQTWLDICEGREPVTVPSG